MLEQRLASESSLARFSRSSVEHLGVRLVDDAAHLLVDEPLRVRRDLGCAGQEGPAPSRGTTATGPIAGLMPQRPTIWRAISVSCWMSDSAPVLVSPKTISSAARPPSATLIFASTSGSR